MGTILAVEHGKLYRAINTLNTKLLYIRKQGKYYIGVFQGNNGIHITHVSLTGDKYYCTCNYYLITGKPCKHIVSMLLELRKRGLLHGIKIK